MAEQRRQASQSETEVGFPACRSRVSGSWAPWGPPGGQTGLAHHLAGELASQENKVNVRTFLCRTIALLLQFSV